MAQITSSVIDLKPTVEQVLTKCRSKEKKRTEYVEFVFGWRTHRTEDNGRYTTLLSSCRILHVRLEKSIRTPRLR